MELKNKINKKPYMLPPLRVCDEHAVKSSDVEEDTDTPGFFTAFPVGNSMMKSLSLRRNLNLMT